MLRQFRTALALLLSGLALAACQTTGSTSRSGLANNQTETADPAVQSTEGGAPGVAPAGAAPAPQPAPQVTARPPAPPPINDDPNQLMGLDRGGVSALLGEPDLVRREEPAEIWQYVTAGCVFDVVLYDAGSRYRVTYLEARDDAADRLAPRPCLNRLLRERQTVPVS
ncbi:hypothetical protein [Pelagibius sp.]|uniref:hypothetical protein n=1 Tax=Pelagibius sp. TaxID=1931238 RepID=UPI002639196E|nr:hypothetical protein [Pelagibius sp.]